MGYSIDSLVSEDQVTHYRALAAEVQYLASEAQFDEVRERFLELAHSWRSIADIMARGLMENPPSRGATPEDRAHLA